MSRPAWAPDQKSDAAETKIVKFLACHYQAQSYERSRSNEYDVVFVLPYGSKRSCEIKTDFLASQTQRLFFEIRNTRHGCASGLTMTHADVWAHYVPHLKKLWLFDPKALLWYLQAHINNPLLGIVLSSASSGDRNSQGYIVPITTVQKWRWPLELEVNA